MRVDYALTGLGTPLLGPIQHLKASAEDHMAKANLARERYDVVD